MEMGRYYFGEFCLDAQQGVLLRGAALVPLPPKPFQVLLVLLQGGGSVVSKARLIREVWPDAFVEDGNLTQCIFLLRKTLGHTAGGVDLIETVPKRGYRITVPVLLTDETTDAAKLEEAANHVEAATAGTPAEDSPAPEAVPLAQVDIAPAVPPIVLTHTIAAKQIRPASRLRAVMLGTGLIAVLAIAMRGAFESALTWRHPSLLRSTRLTNDGIYKERLSSLATDGTRVFFSEDVDARSYFAEVPVEGGETTRRANPKPTDSVLSYSRQNHRLLLGGLWEQSPEHRFVASTLDGSVVRSVGDLSGHAASWSPSGLQVVFAKGTSLFVAAQDGSNAHEIARMSQPPFWPRWSPDGGRIRFSSEPGTGKGGLWEVGADGRNLHPLYPAETWTRRACCGDWSADGRYYAFVVGDARRSTLWVARDRRSSWLTTRPTLLADGPADFWRAPLFAEDGRHIFALGEHAKGELVRFNARSQQFESFLNGTSSDTLSFSPDGSWVAWTDYPEGTLWRSRADGSQRLQLTQAAGLARFPHWSPDGRWIVYIESTPGGSWELFRVPSDGGSPERLLGDSSSSGVATFSPDGTKLVFGELVSFGTAPRPATIRMLDLQTRAVSVLPGSEGLWTARWSPAGDFISAVSTDNRRLMLFDLRTKQWSQVADVGTNDCVWSHDGKYLYFDSPWEPTIYRLRTSDRTLERYASLAGIRRTGFFGWSLNLAPDDSPVLLKEAGIHEVYSLEVDLP